MRLVDLEPRWFAISGRTGMGISLRCPRCSDHRVSVPFANPIDGGPPSPNGKGCAWQRTGDTFDTLTLTPSCDFGDGCWHGFITNGEVT